MAETGSAPAKRMMCSVPERAMLHVAMTAFQFAFAGNHVILRAALNLGVSKFVLPIYRNFLALLMLAPFAYFLEKGDRPALTPSILIQFFFLGLIGITSHQGLYLLGLENTSPTFASAIENSVPAVTFLMATILGQATMTHHIHSSKPQRYIISLLILICLINLACRIEQVHLKRKDGIAKVLGTVASVAGALVITLYKGPIIYGSNPTLPQQLQLLSLGDEKGKNWTMGCIYLIGHCLSWAGWIVFQAIVLKKYPARLTVISYTFFFGILQFWAIAALVERNSKAWLVRSGGELLIILYLGLVGTGFAFTIQIWVIDRAGPVFVSSYLPLQTLLVAVMASIALGEEFYIGGIIGAVLIIAGLYVVLWGKTEETKFAIEQTANLLSAAENDEGATSHGKASLVQPLLSVTSSKS